MASNLHVEQSDRIYKAHAASSAVHTMSVADVRRALAYIRKSWEDQGNTLYSRPFYISDGISAMSNSTNALSMEYFSLMFVLAHHTRRLSKTGM
uniref:Uncharacterized protein n=1 Tax=viral metagenome TaxID=1070528 RepID=A0A6C0C1W7_9ZZZZ